MKLSIVIVNYNVQHFLEQCLISVLKGMKDLQVEVFVVDNNSVDGSVEMLREKFPWVKVIANKENTGFSRANNQAMRVANGEYMLLLNPDTIIEEDTLKKVVTFMDEHPQAGGLGVKMVDGRGNFLPESKRGLPTPETAFYKIFGLSKIFSRSGKFNRYHLGNLSQDEVHEIEVLSGAFMLMRKSALDKVGLLDETFFMYGEDIDLSYRLIKGGWKNYYYPHTRIIHYKGESTKKGSLNYVYVFYNAMVIFAKKHFSESNAKWFSFFINIAIWLRASIAIAWRFAKAITLPLLDILLTLGGLFLIKNFYAEAQGKIYDPQLVQIAFGSYVLIWCMCAWLGGAYDKPVKPLKVFRPLLIGSAIILVAYSLLPESLRFSRALILLGAFVSVAVFFFDRIIINLLTKRNTGLERSRDLRFAIAGSLQEIERVGAILSPVHRVIKVEPSENAGTGFAGTLNQLDEIVRVHNIGQVVFCAKDVSSSDIISAMSAMQDKSIEFKIAPPESLYIIGSNSIESSGDAFVMDVNSVSKPANQRTKRALDIVLSLLFIPLLPLVFVFAKKPLHVLKNIPLVFFGRKTWVGLDSRFQIPYSKLPTLKVGVFSPASQLNPKSTSPEYIQKLNILYAKDFRVLHDLAIVWRGMRSAGN